MLLEAVNLYKLLHTNDIDLFYWRVRYTAGREPGSFYVMRSIIESNSHVLLYIDCSNNYGETFTTHFHNLGEYVGIDTTLNINMSDKLSVYPNPAHDWMKISWTPHNSHINFQLQVHDIMGREVESAEIKGLQAEFKLDVSAYEPGVYFITLIGEENDYISQKFVVSY